MGAAKKTTDHELIRRWVERHGGWPATVKRTRGKDDPGMLRIDFPDFSGQQSLERISWDDWFRKFDEQELAFLYQTGENTNFNKLVRRDPDQVRPSDRKRGPSRTTQGGKAAARALEAERERSRRSHASERGSAAKSGRATSDDLTQRSRQELYAQARSINLPNRSRMSKSELVHALSRARH